MREQGPEGYPPEASTLRTVTELAFGSICLESDIEAAADHLPEDELEYVVDCQIRQKSGYDAVRGCGYDATQIRCVLYDDENGIVNVDMVAIEWSDGFTGVIDTLDLHTEHNTEERLPELEVRSRIMSALMQLIEP